MKLSKRILSFMIVLVFMLTSIVTSTVSAATFSDVTENEKYATAVTVLNSLGIINGYEDGTFRPENNVTRAEFTAMLMRARGLDGVGDASIENPPYPDVVSSDVSWAIGNIRTAQNLGIINGYEDGTFRPNNNVLLEEAVKMIVCAIGYANYSPDGAEWYTKYIVTATKLGILKAVGATVGTPATRAHIAQLIHNTLDVKIADENGVTDNTLLDNELKLTQGTGYIFSNDVTSLETPDVSLKSDYIFIGNENGIGTRYKFRDAGKYTDKLGYRVDFFYSYDKDAGENVISSITLKNNNILDINAADIDTSASNSSVIEYYDSTSDNNKTASIAGDAIVVYNDKLFGATAADSDFSDYLTGIGSFPTVGNIVLLDNDVDNVYDVVFVNDYEVYAVTGVSGSPTYTVTDTLTRVAPNNKIVLNPKTDDNLRFIDKNGATQSFSNISTGSVICVKKSNSGNGGLVLTTVVISKDTAKGSVKSVTSGRRLKIDSTTYDYSYQAPWIDSSRGASLAEPAMGDNGTYYLDIFGDVVAYKKTTTATNQQYAYVIYADKESQDMEDKLALRLFTQNKGLLTAFSDNNTKFNGASNKTADEMLADLQTAASAQAQGVTGTTNDSGFSQVVKISLKSVDGKNIISEIVTGTRGDSLTEVLNDKLQVSNNFYANSKTAEYKKGSNVLKSSAGSASVGSSWIINVPKNRSNEKGYKKISVSNDLINGTLYSAEVYDITTANTAKVIVIYDDLSVTLGVVKTSTPVFVITDIIEESNPNNENKTMYKITGYAGNGKSEVEYWGSLESNAVFATLEAGDVVRFGKDSDNFYTLAEKDILFSKSRNIRDSVIANYATGGTLNGLPAGSEKYYLSKKDSVTGNTTSVLWGYLYACDDTNLIAHDYKYSDKSLVDDGHSYSVSAMSNSLFLKYSANNGSVEIETLSNSEGFNYVDYLKSLPKLVEDLEPTEIFMFDISGIPSVVIIVE